MRFGRNLSNLFCVLLISASSATFAQGNRRPIEAVNVVASNLAELKTLRNLRTEEYYTFREFYDNGGEGFVIREQRRIRHDHGIISIQKYVLLVSKWPQVTETPQLAVYLREPIVRSRLDELTRSSDTLVVLEAPKKGRFRSRYDEDWTSRAQWFQSTRRLEWLQRELSLARRFAVVTVTPETDRGDLARVFQARADENSGYNEDAVTSLVREFRSKGRSFSFNFLPDLIAHARQNRYEYYSLRWLGPAQDCSMEWNEEEEDYFAKTTPRTEFLRKRESERTERMLFALDGVVKEYWRYRRWLESKYTFSLHITDELDGMTQKLLTVIYQIQEVRVGIEDPYTKLILESLYEVTSDLKSDR